MCGQTSEIQVQVSQQVANLPGELTYTNNTSNAQIQISLLGYNLGYRAESERERANAIESEKEQGDRGWREEWGGRGGKGSYISTHTFVRSTI